MKWNTLWICLFGTTEFLGLNMGFWVSMTAVIVAAAIMNVVFWRMKSV